MPPSLNEAIEKLRQIERKLLRRDQQECRHLPVWGDWFVLEVEPTHLDRLRDLIAGPTCHLTASRDADGKAKGVPASLIFSSRNVALTGQLPKECIKYITRQFFVPYCAHEADWLLHRVAALLGGEEDTVVLKVSASPKELEAELLVALAALPCVHALHQTKYTHMLQAVFCAADSSFRWGLSSCQFAEENLLTNDALVSHARCQESAPVVPVCRAFYKVLEIFDLHFPRLGWQVPAGVSCDVGAAPGGWTQVLSRYSSIVISIDPGQLSPVVLGMDNVRYICATLQASRVSSILEELTAANPVNRLRLIVCDVNFEPRQTAEMLRDHILEHLQGMGQEPEACLSPPSYIILTLKMMKKFKAHHLDAVLVRVMEIFQQACPCHANCWQFRTMHLGANSSNERTLCLRLH